MKIIWSDLAKSQLKSIYIYYSSVSNKQITKKLIKKIIDRTDILIDNPSAGTKEALLAHFAESYRYLVVGNYKIIYWVYDETIAISSIFDSRQNPEKLKRDIKKTV